MRLRLSMLLVLFIAMLAQSQTPEGMTLIPGGRYAMGVSELEMELLAQLGEDVPHMSHHYRGWFSPELPLHEVTVDSFYLDTREVTNAEFRSFADSTSYEAEGPWREQAGEGRDEHPVVHVTWKDAAAYAEWRGGRLPSEAEWEWAARGGTENRWFPWGDEPDGYSRANYGHDRTFWGGVVGLLGLQRIKTEPVGSYEAYGYGLYDMPGNAAEWCADDFLPYPGGSESIHPFGVEGYFEHPKKICRGGSWESPNPVYIRINNRMGWAPDGSDWTIGFRCAQSLPHKN